jgi:glutamyl-tRNA reductase
VADHLYRVIAGLRSIVIGEAEVAGQVRTAFELARTAGYTTPLLNDLFQVGFRYAKKVATRTPVGAAGRSGVAIALDHAQKLLGPLDRLDVLVVGTGAYARLGVAELSRRGAGRIRVHSASGRAIEFAQRHGVSAVAADGLAQALREADLVLACSGRGTSLFPEHFRGVGPTLILDLALHSDLHPLVRHLRDVRIVDLSDLRIEVDEDAAPVLEAAQGIIADGVAHFRSRQEFRRVDPAMAALRRSLGEATDHEVARLRREDKDAAADDVERSIRRILAKVMHSPTLRARELAQQGNADEFVQAFHTIFGIDISEAGVAVAGQAGGGDSGGPASAVAATAASDGVGDVHGDERADRRWMRLDQSMPPASARDGRPTTAAPVTGDLTPADLGALADLARIGVARAADEGTAVCPLTAAQQQAFMTQVTRERS